MIYKYRAKKGPEDIAEGTIEAPSEREAVDKLSELGYIPVSIALVSGEAGEETVASPKMASLRIKGREVTIFTRQLATLLKSGVPILAGLNIITEQTENRSLKEVLHNIHHNVKEGTKLSLSLMQYPKIFPPLYIAMINTGESSGVLHEVLFRIADHRLRQEETLSRFRMAMAYPLLMALVGLGTIVFMLTFVMPRLTGIFANLGQTLPLPTRILISTSKILRKWWLWVILALLALISRRQARTASAKFLLDRLKLRLPILGPLILKLEISRFSRTLELLLKSGIPILRAIEVVIPVVNNEIIKKRLQLSYKELEQGGSLGKSLKSAKIFPLFMSNLIIVGEESGRLTEALAEVASSYERDTDEALKITTNLLEPLIILAMGLVVGFMVIAMLLPIFEINVMAR
jgi:type II secretory pathway component PulF